MKKLKKLKKITWSKIPAVITFIVGIAAGIKYSDLEPKHYTIVSKSTSLDICFTPPTGCSTLITREIAKAKNNIYIQAYGFTSNSIVDELIKAKQRNVQIFAILDKSNINDKHSKANLLKQFGIKVSFDTVPGIAHNKVMIIDDSKVITGSFNFTNAADKSNAENLIVIHDINVAKIYLENWNKRYLSSKQHNNKK